MTTADLRIVEPHFPLHMAPVGSGWRMGLVRFNVTLSGNDEHRKLYIMLTGVDRGEATIRFDHYASPVGRAFAVTEVTVRVVPDRQDPR